MAGTVDDKLVKRAHATTAYSREQLDELAACMHPVSGPAYFIKNFMYIQHPMEGAQLIKPFDYQDELLKIYHDYRDSVNLMARQTGKCLEKKVNIKVRNKITGEVVEMPIGAFHDMVSKPPE